MSDILARPTTLTQKPKCHRSASGNRRRMPFASVAGVFCSGLARIQRVAESLLT